MKETPTSAVSRDAGPAIKLFKPVTPRKLGVKCPQSLRNRVSGLLPPRSAELLNGAGHVGLQYMPTVMAVLGDDLRMFLPHPFTPYTLPALELRRVLAEARAASSEPFVLEYDKLPGTVGDESWRQEAVESTVRLSENGHGGRSCRIRAAGAYFWKACADDEPALLPPPSGLLAKIRIFFPLPVRAGLDELPCID